MKSLPEYETEWIKADSFTHSSLTEGFIAHEQEIKNRHKNPAWFSYLYLNPSKLKKRQSYLNNKLQIQDFNITGWNSDISESFDKGQSQAPKQLKR